MRVDIGDSLKELYKTLVKGMSSVAFLLNPAVEQAKEDYTELIDVKYLEQPFEMGNAYFKTPEEIDAFFASKVGVKRKNLKAYQNKYKPLILSVSNIFEIPFSFQSCLIFKESRFDKKAKSHVGAMGVAQFTKDTYDFLSRALRIGERSISSSAKDEFSWDFFSFTAKPLEKKLTYPRYNTKIFGQMHLMWEDYLMKNGLQPIKFTKKAYKRILYTPEYSIGLSAMYLYYLKYRVKYDVEKYVEHVSSDHPDFILSLAGAYNQGARRVLKAVNKSKATPDFSKWLSYQSRVKETEGYIRSIRTCMMSQVEMPATKVLTASQPNSRQNKAK